MFEVLIREAAARFGVGDKALPLMQMLLAAMTAKDTGGLAGFLEKFKAAGLEPLVQSWLGGGEGARPISSSQVEAVLGTGGGLLSVLTAYLGLPRDKITETIGYLLPTLIGRLTPGGALPTNPPPEITDYAQAGQSLLLQAAQALQRAQRTGTAHGGSKWLVWVIVIVIVLAALYAWSQSRPEAPQHNSLPISGTASHVTPPVHTRSPVSGGAAFGGGALPKPASAATPAIPMASAAPSVGTTASQP